ncbi:MAG: phytanoyl-CoA dioxygenase, partial [Pseudomonadota bacterium]
MATYRRPAENDAQAARRATETDTQLRDIIKRQPLRVLSEADFAFWQTYGYVVVRHAVPPENVTQTVDFLWAFTELDRDNPASWNRAQARKIRMAELNNSGMVEAYNHPA